MIIYKLLLFHFQVKGQESEKLVDVIKVTQLGKGRTGTGT